LAPFRVGKLRDPPIEVGAGGKATHRTSNVRTHRPGGEPISIMPRRRHVLFPPTSLFINAYTASERRAVDTPTCLFCRRASRASAVIRSRRSVLTCLAPSESAD
jgi:hypothetical protein